jgi:hypothetical protein
MKHNKSVIRMAFTALVATVGAGVAPGQAANAAPAQKATQTAIIQEQVSMGNPVTLNPQFKGVQSPVTARKKAARRLRALRKQQLQNKLNANGNQDQTGAVQ